MKNFGDQDIRSNAILDSRTKGMPAFVRPDESGTHTRACKGERREAPDGKALCSPRPLLNWISDPRRFLPFQSG